MDKARAALKSGPLTLGIIVFDKYELLDTYGPMELVVGATAAVNKRIFKVLYISTSTEPVASTGGIKIQPDFAISDPNLPPIDILFVPGGIGTRPLQKDEGYVARLKELGSSADLVVTVCTGSMLFAATGLLDGVRATSNKVAFRVVEAAYPNVQWVEKARWVTDGKFYTSSGVSAGMDMMLSFLRELVGVKPSDRGARLAEYVPNDDASRDPFASLVENNDRRELHEKISKDLRPGVLKVGVLVYENFELLDTFGPCEMFKMADIILSASPEKKGVEMTLVAEDNLVHSVGGPVFVAKRFDEVDLDGFDLMLLPGGIGTIRELYNSKFKEAMGQMAAGSDHVMTVCTGSALLASLGVLDGRPATTNKYSFDMMRAFRRKVKWVEKARWVQSDKYYTSSGVSAGIDLSLQVLKDLYSEDLAKEAAMLSEYEWNNDPQNDPFVGLIAKQTLGRRLIISTQRALVGTIFSTGFVLGSSMKGVTTKLLGPVGKL